MEAYTPINQEQKLDFTPFFKKLKKNFYLFIIFITIALSLSFAINRYSSKIYKVTAKLYIPYTSNPNILATNIFAGLTAAGYLSLTNEIQILKAYPTVEGAINKLNFEVTYIAHGTFSSGEIYKKAPFKIKYLSGNKDRLYKNHFYLEIIDEEHFKLSFSDSKISNKQGSEDILFGETFQVNNCQIKIVKNDLYFPPNQKSELYDNSYEFWFNKKANLIKKFQGSLNVSNTKGTNILLIQSNSPIPEKSIDLINTLMQVYIEESLKDKQVKVENVIAFIEDQTQKISDLLILSETSLKNFKTSHKIFNIESEGGIRYEKLKLIDTEITTMELELHSIGILSQYIKNNEDINLLPPVTLGINEQSITSLISKFSELVMEREQIYPDVNTESVMLKNINQNIEVIKNSIFNAIESAVYSKNERIKELSIKIIELEKELWQLPDKELEYLHLSRKFEVNQNIYISFLQKKIEAEISKASITEKSRVLQAAEKIAKPIKPKTTNNYMISILVGLSLPIIIVFLKLYFDNSIKDEIQIEKLCKIPIIGTIGHNYSSNSFVVSAAPRSIISESFRSIRTNLQYLKGKNKENKIILITSVISGEGKTFISLNLSSILAYANKKVVLLGLDLRRPRIHRSFNIKNTNGLSNYLIGKSKIDEIINHTDINNLDLISAGPVPPNPSEIIMREELEILFDELKKKYDYIILDTPPIGLVTDATILMNHADTCIFIIRQNFSKTDYLTAINDLYNVREKKNLYLLINDFKLAHTKYGTKYSYNYGYKYGYGKHRYKSYEYYSDDVKKRGLLSRLLNKQ